MKNFDGLTRPILVTGNSLSAVDNILRGPYGAMPSECPYRKGYRVGNELVIPVLHAISMGGKPPRGTLVVLTPEADDLIIACAVERGYTIRTEYTV
jgi:hypothetical protein